MNNSFLTFVSKETTRQSFNHIRSGVRRVFVLYVWVCTIRTSVRRYTSVMFKLQTASTPASVISSASEISRCPICEQILVKLLKLVRYSSSCRHQLHLSTGQAQAISKGTAGANLYSFKFKRAILLIFIRSPMFSLSILNFFTASVLRWGSTTSLYEGRQTTLYSFDIVRHSICWLFLSQARNATMSLWLQDTYKSIKLRQSSFTCSICIEGCRTNITDLNFVQNLSKERKTLRPREIRTGSE